MLERRKRKRKREKENGVGTGITDDLIDQVIHFICADEECLKLKSFREVNVSNILFACREMSWLARQ
jgi:hypothetical protein